MRRLAWLPIALALACAHVPAPAPAKASAPAPGPMPRETVERLLQQGASGGRWRALDGDPLPPLEAIAGDAQEPHATRAAALSAMVFVQDGRATEVLAARTRDPQEDATLRITALRALALRVGRPGAARVAVSLSDPDPRLRTAAARALGLLGGAKACQALADRLDAEADLTVREALQESLSKAQP